MSTRPKLPDFRPPAYRDLVHALGESDAAVEWVEVAILHLAAYVGTNTSLAATVAERTGVRVTAFSEQRIRASVAHLQLASVYFEFDHFIRECRRDSPRPFRPRDSREGHIEYLSTVLPASRATLGILECSILDYYTDVRHAIAHPDTRRKGVTPSTRLMADVKTSVYGALSAPHDFAALDFDDFVLFSRAVKAFAQNVCAAATPTDQEVAGRLGSEPDTKLILASLKENPERLRQKLATSINTRYGLRGRSHAIADLIVSAAR